MDVSYYAEALKHLTPKQEKVLRLRYGVGCDRPHELLEIAQEFDVNVRNIRQILKAGLARIHENHNVSAADLGSLGQWEQGVRNAKPLIIFRNEKEQAEVCSGVVRLFDEANIAQETLLTLTPRQFEELVAEVWNKLGFAVELTAQTRDGGRDIVAIRRLEAEVRYLIECKRYDPEHKVGVQFVRALYGVKVDDKATKAFLATTSSFTKPALDFCADHRWELEPRDFEGVKEWINLAKGFRRTESGLLVPR